MHRTSRSVWHVHAAFVINEVEFLRQGNMYESALYVCATDTAQETEGERAPGAREVVVSRSKARGELVTALPLQTMYDIKTGDISRSVFYMTRTLATATQVPTAQKAGNVLSRYLRRGSRFEPDPCF